MLEQRRAAEKGYISLKEAAQLSNYSPDYIGQLIRAGKIRGEQVYSNVAWMTTEEEIDAYLKNKSRTVGVDERSAVSEYLQKRLLSTFVYVIIFVLFLSLLFLQYVLYVTLDDAFTKHLMSTTYIEERT